MLFTCARCQKEVPKRQGQNKYCLECAYRAYKDRDKQKLLEKTGGTAVGALFACRQCGKQFPKRGGRHFFCDECAAERQAARHKRYRDRHPDEVKARHLAIDKKRRHDPERRVKMREYALSHVKRHIHEPHFALNRRMSSLVRRGLINGKGGRTWTSLLDYTVADLAKHLERQFQRGMSWKNMNKWHIDHILPIASFAFTSTDDPEFKACWALTNLRPLWASENIRKRDRRLTLL